MRSKDTETFAATIEREKARIAKRDKEYLSIELDWLITQPGLSIPPCKKLDDYCYWLSPEKPDVVKWDLLRHYASEKNTTPYFPVYQTNKGTIFKPNHRDYNDRLITHTLPVVYWNSVKKEGFLPGHPMVCFASGQVVFTGSAIDGMYSITVIFDRRVLERVYTLLPYTDHETEWEREVRAYEPICLDLALDCIPTSEFIHELSHWGQLTCVCGKQTMANLEKQFLETGRFDGN